VMNNDERIIGLLEELVAWTRLSAREGVLALLRQVLADPRHLRAYELTDGVRTQKEVGDAVGLAQPSISQLYAKWRRLGIVREKEGKIAHLARPSELGLESDEASPADERPRRRARQSREEGADGREQ
jgi:hypothetical protein